ncbi:MAG: queuosine precursor transporter, partial [Gammaproteobacteria bacterium]
MITTLGREQKTFLYLMTAHTALLVASNAGGAKMIAVTETLAASATVFSYSITFLLIGMIAELYGRDAAKTTIKVGFASLILSVAFFMVSIAAPPASFWNGQAAYEATLGLGPRLLLGGWTAYMVSQFMDVAIFWAIRKMTRGRHLWLRAVGSMTISQFVDTVVFMTIAFYGLFPLTSAIAG